MEFSPNQSIAPYTTFNIGGNARYLVEVYSIEDVHKALHFAKKNEIDFFVLGKGSNTLVSDGEFDGLVIVNKIQTYRLEGEFLEVGGGFNFSLLGVKTARAGLGGLEFASGIPGTVGGAVFMNAGANKQETCDFISYVDFVSYEGLKRFSKKELVFSYRTSMFQKMKGVIVGAGFELKENKGACISQRTFLDYRLSTQPYKAKTAGCCFRNPPEDSAGRLIESCGLKGFKIGGAMVSLKHANFIENTQDATAQDVRNLVAHVQKMVYDKTKIKLELEVRTLDI